MRVPDKIAVKKLFSIKVSACVGKDSEAPRRIRVYAGMPMHGHGINYKSSERKLGPWHSAFDSVLFYMPGSLQLTRKVKIGR